MKRLTSGPLPLPSDWAEQVNIVQTEAKLAALRRSIQRGAPFGDDIWQQRTVTALGLQSTGEE